VFQYPFFHPPFLHTLQHCKTFYLSINGFYLYAKYTKYTKYDIYTTLHYTTLHYTTLHYTTLHYITTTTTTVTGGSSIISRYKSQYRLPSLTSKSNLICGFASFDSLLYIYMIHKKECKFDLYFFSFVILFWWYQAKYEGQGWLRDGPMRKFHLPTSTAQYIVKASKVKITWK
jgi:hypothetical protein